MERTKLLIILVICLVLLNLGLLTYILFGSEKAQRPEPGRKPRPREIIIEKLKFNDEQIEKYTELIKEHRAMISELEKGNIKLKNKLYQCLLTSPKNKQVKDSIIYLLGENQKLIENVHFNHFADIKQLCEPKQMEFFEELATELSGIFGPPRKHRKND